MGTKKPWKLRREVRKLPRSINVAVRLDARLKFASDLGARVHNNQTLSSFIEWALSRTVRELSIRSTTKTVQNVVDEVWDIDPADRLIKLAFAYPQLLSYSEELIFKAIKGHPAFWTSPEKQSVETCKLKNVRAAWEHLTKIGNEESTESDLAKDIEIRRTGG